ncbi:MAG: D-2-hydroxyacid dehydrogenase [Clostridia bacterium]
MKIVVLDGYTENPGDLSWDDLKALGELSVYDRTPADMVVERIADAEIVIVNKTLITKEIITACPSIKYIGVLATGYNVVDVDAAKEQGIPVCNIPTYGTSAVAQFVFALLLEICHRVQNHSNSVVNGDWTNCQDFCFWLNPLVELAGKTIGLVGFGRIGIATAKIAKGFGMEVLAYDSFESEEGKSLATYVSLDELLEKSDVVSLHVPLFESTQGIINKNTLAKMKSSAILINTSRGPLVVEEDLKEALNNGTIYAAGVDVVSTEPIKMDNPLLQAKNCIVTPHIAWAPKESRQRLMNIAVDNVKAFIEGNPVNVVNK